MWRQQRGLGRARAGWEEGIGPGQQDGGLACTSPSAGLWEQHLCGCQLAGHSGRSGWALAEGYQGPWFSGAPLKPPLPQSDPPAPAEAVVATGSHQLCCPSGDLTHLDTTVGARRAWGAAGRGQVCRPGPGQAGSGGGSLPPAGTGGVSGLTPFLGGLRQQVARCRGPHSPTGNGARGRDSVAQRGGKGARSRSAAWTRCQQALSSVGGGRPCHGGPVRVPEAPSGLGPQSSAPLGVGLGLVRARDLAP